MIHFFGKVDFFEEGGIFIIILPGISDLPMALRVNLMHSWALAEQGRVQLVAEIEARIAFLRYI